MTIPTEVAASCPDCHSQNLGCYNATAQLMVCNDCAQIIDTELSRRRKESALTKAEAEPVAWRLRIGASDVWAYCANEMDADFHGVASGLNYFKEPLYAHAPPAVQSEQVIELLLAGGFVTQAKVDQARKVVANCAHAVPVEPPASVPDGWQAKAAAWLEGKAVEQEANNMRWPEHAAAYKEWRDRPMVLRMLAQDIATPAA